VNLLDQAQQRPITQAEFAALVGLGETRVSQLVADGVLEKGVSAHEWLRAYCERLREVAAGRASGEVGGLDLVQERAALARQQRLNLEVKGAVLAGEYGPISLLAEVLAAASQAIVDRLDQLPAVLKKRCPELPDAARSHVMTVIAEARNEWVTHTSELVVAKFTDADSDEAVDG
jgi:phage terminase Nu1 subunit (DNA packaging protein)